MKFRKGQKVLVSVTYEIQIEMEDDFDSSESEGGMGELASAALLASGDLDSHCVETDIISIEGENLLDKLEKEEESGDWKLSKEAVRKWAEICKGKPRDLFPDLSVEQMKFVQDVISSGMGQSLQAYSGRNMFGRYCPAVVVSHPSALSTTVSYKTDSMGKSDIVLYVP